ncbi:Thiol:disulfide oxidoreductase related to ResA [Olavius sp. associated proteobacterium Delta 1]|nr:Thiol:disulfide oxidoreductase related to ResA [Olavius sp. associated proteobacterium Delta 1]
MKKIGKYFHLISIVLSIFILNSYIFEDRARGETNFLESLSLIRFDEKIMAQNFALKDLNGNVVHLEDYRGKVIFLNFWTTWCPPCRIEMPSMEKLYIKFKNNDFIILAVDMQEDSETVRKFKAKFKLSFPILLDEEGVVASYYGVTGIPATYFIDRAGYLYAAAMGARDWASEDAFQLIKHLLDK